MSLTGEASAISESVNPTIGYYTYPGDWGSLTDHWQNYDPSWVASNSNYKNVATKDCTKFRFNGGETLLTQYTKTIDFDIACQ
jgi:predicted transcriptional regulator